VSRTANGFQKADKLHSRYLHAIARKSAPRTQKVRVRHPLAMTFRAENFSRVKSQ
jgi:hypothetical protein